MVVKIVLDPGFCWKEMAVRPSIELEAVVPGMDCCAREIVGFELCFRIERWRFESVGLSRRALRPISQTS